MQFRFIVYKCKEYFDENERRETVATFDKVSEANKLCRMLSKTGMDSWVVDTFTGKKVTVLGGVVF